MNQPDVKWDDEQSKPQGKKYRHTAVNRKTGQRIGSDDGTTWHDLATGEPYRSE